jgi:DNA-binding beta-propeller fold protein YncE
MGMYNNMLYVADIDNIKVYDSATHILTKKIDFSQEKTTFLNDITITGNTLYISATDKNSIFVVDLINDTYQKLTTDKPLQ